MSLHEQIKGEIKQAMLAKDELRLSVVRGLVTALTNESVARGGKPTDILTDEDTLAVIRRGAKQRKDSIEQFRAGGREDLASKEEAELKLLEAYLPKMMDKSEVKKIAEAKKTEMGINDKSQSGQFMSTLMKELKGKADGADVKAVVDELLA